MKEISYKDLNKYVDTFKIFSDGALTLVRDEKNNKYNPMTIGWGSLGILWSMPVCTVYIHKTRYSKCLFDNESYFSVSIPLNSEDLKICGTLSGKDNDKVSLISDEVLFDNNIPYLKNSKLVILCEKIGESDFDNNKIYVDRINSWYEKDGVHSIYQGKIIKVLIEE